MSQDQQDLQPAGANADRRLLFPVGDLYLRPAGLHSFDVDAYRKWKDFFDALLSHPQWIALTAYDQGGLKPLPLITIPLMMRSHQNHAQPEFSFRSSARLGSYAKAEEKRQNAEMILYGLGFRPRFWEQRVAWYWGFPDGDSQPPSELLKQDDFWTKVEERVSETSTNMKWPLELED